MQETVCNFKKTVSKFFGPHCDLEMNTLNVHLLQHLVDDLGRFEIIQVLSAYQYKNFNIIVEQAYLSNSKRL